jgi:hypothetical protein
MNNVQPAAKRVVYDEPSRHPNESLHWKRVAGDSTKGDDKELMLRSHDELVTAFQSDVDSFKLRSHKENYKKLALWSCVIGYCEALSTNRNEEKRYSIFPVPHGAMNVLVDEFVGLLIVAPHEANNVSTARETKADMKSSSKPSTLHRHTVQSVSNSVWKRAQNKSQMKDKLHANSLYVCLCGDVDNKSLDCFGAALLTVIGMNILGFESCLTLSEDHAYESHWEDADGSCKNESNDTCTSDTQRNRATCEVAIPGNTKASINKRGKEISETFGEQSAVTPNTSWLYMASNPVICDKPGMVMAAILGNVNCDVEKLKKASSNDDKPQVASSALYKLKRDMLWILLDEGYLTQFPFALMELGECEEHFGSARGMKWVDVGDLISSEFYNDGGSGEESAQETIVLWNEKLFLDAICISRTVYDDSQVYPYLCE